MRNLWLHQSKEFEAQQTALLGTSVLKKDQDESALACVPAEACESALINVPCEPFESAFKGENHHTERIARLHHQALTRSVCRGGTAEVAQNGRLGPTVSGNVPALLYPTDLFVLPGPPSQVVHQPRAFCSGFVGSRQWRSSGERSPLDRNDRLSLALLQDREARLRHVDMFCSRLVAAPVVRWSLRGPLFQSSCQHM